MDIGGVNKLNPSIAVRERNGVEKSNTHADRDPQGRQQREDSPVKQLTPQQEEEALKKLNTSPAFLSNGLKAELHREDGKRPHIVVKKANGEIVRNLPYAQIISIYLEPNQESGTGLLLKKSA